MRVANDLYQQLVVRRIDVQHIHLGCGHHDVGGRAVCHAQHTFEHDAGVGADDLVVFSLGQGFDQFILGIQPRMDELDDFLEKSTLIFALSVARRMRV